MCDHYNINPRTYGTRIRESGWTKEQALTFPAYARPLRKPGDTLRAGAVKLITDHEGKEYATYVELADAYNIPYLTLYRRLERGWAMRHALTKPVRGKR